MTRSRFLAPLGATLLSLLAPASARADQIDRAMLEDSAAIAKAVRGLGKNVAVLKFQTKFGAAPAGFRAGTEGADMVRRVENVLVLTADPNQPEVNVLTGAGAEAAKLGRQAGAPLDWTTAAGRRKMFNMALPLAWDDAAKLAPDAFITGTVRTSANLKELFVDLKGFTRAEPDKLVTLGTLTGSHKDARGIRVDRSTLAAMGRSFVTPRELKAAKARAFVAADEAATADAEGRAAGAGEKAPNPVKLEVFFDDSPATPEPDAGSRGEYRLTGRVGTPAAGQKVRFALTNAAPERVAVLLAVNGKNTIALDDEPEDLAAPNKPREQFRMWVLEPGLRYEVRGFLKSVQEGSFSEFLVPGADQSRAAFDALNPGYDGRGKIQMFVYGAAPEVKVEDDPLVVPAESEPAAPASSPAPSSEEDPLVEMNAGIDSAGLQLVASRTLGHSRSFADYQRALSVRTKVRTNDDGKLVVSSAKGAKRREMIIDGGKTTEPSGEVKVVPFKYDPNPLAAVQITYYAPEGQ